MQDDALYALQNKDVQRRRRAMLNQPHIKPLCDYNEEICAERGETCEIPHFDPLDGGVNAKVLFLFEWPRAGVDDSGFVSRENPDGTARIFREMCSRTGIARQDTISWNVVPWHLTGDMTQDDIHEALPYLRRLIAHLPKLKSIVLFGGRTAHLKNLLASETKLHVATTWMPTQRVLNVWPHKEAEIAATLREVARRIR